MTQFTQVPESFNTLNEWVRRTAQKINQMLDGKTNNTGSVTLTASTTTTTVTDRRVGVESAILFMPTTANASAEVGAGGFYVSTQTAGTSFVITHANNAQTDRAFRYIIVG